MIVDLIVTLGQLALAVAVLINIAFALANKDLRK